MFSEVDEQFMGLALDQAAIAAQQGEVPIGAIVVAEGEVIAQAYNQVISLKDPSAHAEVLALRQAAQFLDNYRLINTHLYVTLEPCMMCAGALVHARVGRLVYGTTEPKAGVIESQQRLLDSEFLNHQVKYSGGLRAVECSEIMQQFFQQRRAEKKLK